jgi:hypothetical protein
MVRSVRINSSFLDFGRLEIAWSFFNRWFSKYLNMTLVPPNDSTFLIVGRAVWHARGLIYSRQTETLPRLNDRGRDPQRMSLV